ncbi:MAG TPA: molybdopterin cofactor-binding domain-containing protein [Candidatus Dormibacteraeota bacterium]|nr:molybdopterin cofactor-binding domain-containing protein [Candidatus Dormibacteraeota bacterium]
MAVTTMIGAKIHRREDPRLVSGHGRYVDDMTRPGMLHMAVVRSPMAHAKIKSIDLAAAKKAPGVEAVYTYADFKDHIAGGLPVSASFVAEKKQTPNQFPIAHDEVVYQGEPVAVVLAAERYQALDAAALVEVDYASLPAVMDIEKAMASGSPTAHTGAPDNIGWELTYAPESPDAMKEAEVVVKERILQQRLFPIAMEGRGVVAEYDSYDKRLTLWTSSQVPHFIRLFVGTACGLAESQVRVIAGPDVGGGFGSKLRPYPEEYLAVIGSKLTRRPVKWIEQRSENLIATTHGRGQIFDIEVGAKKDGTLVALNVTQYLDIGAYQGVFGAFQAVACLLAGGAYRWKHVASRTVGVLTNKTSTDPYRGAGRPEATHLVERAVDLVAQKIGMDPAEIRRKNFATEFPFTNNFGLSYDSGDYHKSLDKALELVNYKDLRREQEALRKQGRYLGIGLSTWIEICGLGPSAATAPAAGVALVESSQVRIHPTGGVTVYVGTHSHGQSHDTTFAQIVADKLGVPYEAVELRHGDTAEGPAMGYGTYGSRSLAVGGMSIVKSCHKVIDKAKKIAAHVLEAAEDDVVFDQGQFYVKGSREKSKSIGEIAFASYGAGLPEGLEQGLEAVSYFDPPNFTWPFGAHVCVVEVDPETGRVDMRKYVAVDDCGNLINPMIVDGQVAGGIVQGIAQALFEEVIYDDEGQLRTGTLTDYLVPTANEIPELVLDKTITPSPTNELGVKGIGEAGTIASSAAVINAIVDALSPFGITHVDMPASPDRLWKQIKEARK